MNPVATITPPSAKGIGEHLAAAFGAKVVYESDWSQGPEKYVTVRRSDGFKLSVNLSSDRYIINRHLPRLGEGAYLPREESGGHLQSDVITMSASRSTKSIVADVQRRLLPDYERLLAVYTKANAEAVARRKRTEAMGDELGAILGARPPYRRYNQSDAEVMVRLPSELSCYGDWRPYVDVDEKVNVEVRACPYDLAVQIAETIAKWRKNQ